MIYYFKLIIIDKASEDKGDWSIFQHGQPQELFLDEQ